MPGTTLRAFSFYSMITVFPGIDCYYAHFTDVDVGPETTGLSDSRSLLLAALEMCLPELLLVRCLRHLRS